MNHTDPSQAPPAGHGEAAHDGRQQGAAHATLKGYLTGFALSVALTAVPFWLVMDKVLGRPSLTVAVILGLGAVQIVVHMIYFLHMNARAEGGWNLMALMFTLTLVVIALAGSLWVMYHLNQNMVPMSEQGARNLP